MFFAGQAFATKGLPKNQLTAGRPAARLSLAIAESRHGCDEFARIGMLGTFEKLFDRSRFDDSPLFNDDDPMADMLDHSQIMRNEHHRQTESCLQIDQQIENLGLRRDIERRNRLVTNQKFWGGGKSLRNRHTLALAAGKCGRPAGKEIGR